MDARAKMSCFLSGVATLGVCFSSEPSKTAEEIVNDRIARIKQKCGGSVSSVLAKNMREAAETTEKTLAEAR